MREERQGVLSTEEQKRRGVALDGRSEEDMTRCHNISMSSHQRRANVKA
jgi:hypothetical protein